MHPEQPPNFNFRVVDPNDFGNQKRTHCYSNEQVEAILSGNFVDQSLYALLRFVKFQFSSFLNQDYHC